MGAVVRRVHHDRGVTHELLGAGNCRVVGAAAVGAVARREGLAELGGLGPDVDDLEDRAEEVVVPASPRGGYSSC